LVESVTALREVWKGELVTFQGEHVRLRDAACTPAPPVPPRVVVGVGNSRRLIDAAVGYADELNVYGDREMFTYAQEQAAQAGREIPISVFAHRGEDWTPDGLVAEIRPWRDQGASCYFLTVGWDDDVPAMVNRLAGAKREVSDTGTS